MNDDWNDVVLEIRVYLRIIAVYFFLVFSKKFNQVRKFSSCFLFNCNTTHNIWHDHFCFVFLNERFYCETQMLCIHLLWLSIFSLRSTYYTWRDLSVFHYRHKTTEKSFNTCLSYHMYSIRPLFLWGKIVCPNSHWSNSIFQL